jgi:YD repeat-containing protein
MIKRIILYFLAFIFACSSKAQTADNLVGSVVATPPNSAAFTQYAKVPVGEFTGIPDIKIPLYDIKVDNYHLPVSLSYYAKGVQPNVHSGWVGTGWSLIAAGVINRKINGIADEYCSDYVTYPPPTGNSQYGWYFGANHTQHYSVTSVLGNVQTAQYNTLTLTKVVDTAPDEFDFSIGNLSGAFFMGEDGNWKVRSANGETIKIQEVVGMVNITPLQTPAQFNHQTINPTFIQFTLTTGDGTKYVFGGGTGQNTTIEFNRRGPSNESYNNNMVAMAWHIKEIDLPSGKKIFFDYFRDGSLFTYSPAASNTYISSNFADGTTLAGSTRNEVDFSMNVMDPVYLKSITFPEGKLTFKSYLSGELDNLESGSPYNIRTAFNNIPGTPSGVFNSYKIWYTYNDLNNNYSFNSQGNINSIWYRLDDVELKDYSGNTIKDFQLKYTKDANTRLFLQSVQETSAGVALPPYTFSYNNTALPAYCTIHTDHWGFYNGAKVAPGFSYDGNGFVTTTFQNSYYQFREPDTTNIKAGILTQINYPSGGYSQFFYEANQYSKWIGTPISINQLSTTMFGGGLRVRKIISTDNANLTPITYEYSYVNNLVNNVSSGVLGMAKPNYAENDPVAFVNYDTNGNPVSLNAGFDFGFWGANPINPSQNDDGNIVTYTNVIERQSRNGVYNGMKVTVFSNHDNGYANNSPDATVHTLKSAIGLFHYSDRAFERGMVLSETTYDQSNNPVKAIQNTYNNDSQRFNLCIRAIYCSLKQQLVNMGITRPGNYYFPNNSAIRYFTFYPYLKQTVEKDYPIGGGVNTVTTTTNYSYDPTYDGFNGTKNLVTTKKTDSRGQVQINNIKYPLDYNVTGTPSTNDPFTVGIGNLQNPNLYAVSMPVENTMQVSNSDGSNLRTIASTLNSYDAYFPFPNLTYKASITNPLNAFTSSSVSSVSGSLVKDNSYEARVSIDNFDSVGNPLQEHTAKGPNQSYQWGYNNNYLVAIVKNASNTYNVSANTGVKNFFYDSFEEGNGNSSLADSKTGRYSYDGTSAAYTKTLNHIDNGNYTLTYWKKSGSTWLLQTQTVTITGNTYAINLSGQIDDVRLYPSTAQMTTYTYDVLIGMTSSTDTKAEITYYEYDAFRRLADIKDKDGNIVKYMTYHYANQPTQSPSTPVTVSSITGTAISLYYIKLTEAPSTSCYLQYTDLSTSSVYQYAITCGASGSTTVLVPTAGHTYRFVIVQNLTAGGQVVSIPTDIYVPTY